MWSIAMLLEWAAPSSASRGDSSIAPLAWESPAVDAPLPAVTDGPPVMGPAAPRDIAA